MKSETGFDHSLYERFPTEKRPDSEVEELTEIWKAPKGWGRLTAVNNNYVGFWYVANPAVGAVHPKYANEVPFRVWYCSTAFSDLEYWLYNR